MEPATPYYGAVVRKLFIISGLVILISLPFLKTLIKGPVFYSLFLVIALVFFAGITSPKYKKTILVDVFVSAIGFGIFGYQAIMNYPNFLSLFFITNFVLAVLFLFAFYWSVKTAREIKFSLEANSQTKKSRPDIVHVSEDAPPPVKRELSEEERRRKRFLNAED